MVSGRGVLFWLVRLLCGFLRILKFDVPELCRISGSHEDNYHIRISLQILGIAQGEGYIIQPANGQGYIVNNQMQSIKRIGYDILRQIPPQNPRERSHPPQIQEEAGAMRAKATTTHTTPSYARFPRVKYKNRDRKSVV